MPRAKSYIDYAKLVDKAMRDIVRMALQRINDKPEDVCYLVVIDTTHKKLSIPNFIREEYPDNMVLLMKNKFTNFVLGKDNFKIDIKFKRKEITLSVPLEAILFFSDQKVGTEFKFADGDTDNMRYKITESDEGSTRKTSGRKKKDEDKSDNLINFSDLKKGRK